MARTYIPPLSPCRYNVVGLWAPPGGYEKVQCFCFFVTLLKGRVCANDFVITVFECGNSFRPNILDREGLYFVFVRPCSTLSLGLLSPQSALLVKFSVVESYNMVPLSRAKVGTDLCRRGLAHSHHPNSKLGRVSSISAIIRAAYR